MATTRCTAGDAPAAGSDASGVAAALREASFAHVVAHADGDAVAAGGLLASAAATRGTPYQLSVASTRGDATRRVAEADESTTCVAVGVDAPAAAASLAGPAPASVAAFDAARDLDADPDPVRALAGLVAAGATPGDADGGRLRERVLDGDAAERPGVAVPTEDLADGLAHSTLLFGPASGNPGEAQATLAELGLPVELDEEAHRAVASAVALDAVADAPPSAAEAVARAVGVVAPAAPFATVGGFADVLDATARRAPGTATALALGHDVREAALDVWREYATAVHAAVRGADVARYSGLVVARVGDAPTWVTARLLRDFRSPEPVALAAGDGEVTLATADDRDAHATLGAAAGEAAVGGTASLAYAAVDDVDATVEAVRGEA